MSVRFDTNIRHLSRSLELSLYLNRENAIDASDWPQIQMSTRMSPALYFVHHLIEPVAPSLLGVWLNRYNATAKRIQSAPIKRLLIELAGGGFIGPSFGEMVRRRWFGR